MTSCILLPNVIKDKALTGINFDDNEIFKANLQIFLGGMTKSNLSKLLNDGDIEQSDYDKVFDAAHHYFKHVLIYIQHKFSLLDELLINARWIDVPKWISSSWADVEYFLQHYSVLSKIPQDELYDEYVEYQTLEDNEIGMHA